MSYRANLNISKKHIGFLIGPKGKIINGLKRKHGVYASIDERNCVYKLNGPQAAVEAAINDIRTHINWINGISSSHMYYQSIFLFRCNLCSYF